MTLSAPHAHSRAGPTGAAALRVMGLYRALVETALDGVVTCDADGVIAFINSTAARLFGYAGGGADRLNLAELLAPQSRDACRQALADPTGDGRLEVVGLHADGSTFPVLLALGRTALPDGHLVTAIVRDLSAVRAAQAEARRHLDALAHVTRLASISDLAAGLAHEISQPLTAILAHAGASRRLLADSRVPPSAIAQAIEQIQRQGQRAADLVHHLRTFMRPNDTELRPSLLNDGVREVMDLLHGEIAKLEAEVELDMQPRLPALAMDRVAIEQVIFNLVRNALDALSQVPVGDRRLWVRTCLDGTRRALALTVGDRGPGLPPGDPERVFEPYFSTKPCGLGLGLSICRSIVESHGGTLWATRNNGHGSSFHFMLPLDRSAPT